MAVMAESRRFASGLTRRYLWLVPGLALGFCANALSQQHGLGLWPLLAFGIAPHLAILAGIGQAHARGQLAPRAVPLFNATHHPVPPVVVLGLAAAGILSPLWSVGALAWLSHIVVDRALGDGLRTPEGWRRPSWLSR